MNCLKLLIFFLITTCGFAFTSEYQQEQTDVLIQKFILSENKLVNDSVLLTEIKNSLDSVDNDKAIIYWKTLIEFCKKTNRYYGTGYCNFNMGILLGYEGDYFESLLAYKESIKNYEIIKNSTGLARVYNGLGILYDDLNKKDLALSNYYKSAELFKNMNNSNYARIYLNIGGILVEMDSLQMAKTYLGKSKSILLAEKDSSYLVHCFINLSEVFLAEKEIDSAGYYLLKSYEFSRGDVDIIDKFFALYHLGEFHLNSGDISKAKPLLTEAYNLVENENDKNSIPLEDRANAVKCLSELYEKMENYENAYSLLTEYLKYDNAAKRDKTNLEISRMAFKEQENKTKQEINRRLWTMYISIAGLLASLLLLFSFYRSYKHKKEANRLLTEMDELKNRLYSNITHELRTPLTLILGPLEQMLSSEKEKTPSRKQVKMMRKNANSLLSLVNQMLDLSKIDAKNMKLELVEDDINKFLRIRFAAFASLAEQKSINYNCSLLNEINIRIFDESKLEKIVNNLLSNAIKFTRSNGTINCYANFLHPNTLELIVKDDGKGIPKNELNTIFDRFYQAKTNDEVINIGTGIGLSLTKELVELMHGEIMVESEVGRGSKFTVTLPLGTEHLTSDEFQMIQNLNTKIRKYPEISEAPEITEECINIKDSNKVKQNLPLVLIVEDNNDIREFIAENLSDCFIVEKAGNGKAGLKRAIKNIPDLVITDIVMPKMDGIELCNNLKTDERTSHIPVVMLTGKSSIDDRLSGLDTGADAYLTKPFNIKELKLRVIKLIEQRQKLRERFTRDLRLEPKDIAVTSADEKFITRAMEIIEKNIGNSEFEVRQFQDEMYMSRMQLFRKIKALTNQTPGEFIRTIRLKRAASLLKQNFGNIAQITYEVGFNNPSYFAKCFKDLFGELPSDFIKEHHA